MSHVGRTLFRKKFSSSGNSFFIAAFFIAAFFSSVFLSSRANADATASTQQILSTFSASCPSQGQWTQNALNQSLNLVAILEAVKNDPACQSVNGALTQLNSLSNRIAQVSTQSVAIQINNLKNQESSLLLQLASTTDPNVQYEIQSTLSTIESTLASFYVSDPQTANTSAVETNALTDFTSGTQIILSQLAANQTCLLAHPNILTGIASLAGSVASATLSAGASLATSAAVSIVNSVVEYVRENKLQKKINVFADANAVAAYECALESISNYWCSAEDAKKIIQFKENSLTPAAVRSRQGTLQKPSNFWSGVSLLDYDLPIFVNWLNQVRSGNPATTQPEGDSQSKEFTRQEDVLTAQSESAGIFNGGATLFNKKIQAGDTQGAWTIEKSLISAYIAKIGGGSSIFGGSSSSTPNPLFDIYSSTCAPYVMLGLSQSQWPVDPNSHACDLFETFNPFTNWPIPNAPFAPSLDAVIKNTDLWINAAQQTVQAELTQVLQADPRSIFQDAVDPDQHGRSPAIAIQHFIDFLTAQKDVGGYLADTINRLTEIQTQINSVIEHGSDPDNSFSKTMVSTIYDEAQLQYGPTLFQGRLQRAFHNALNQLITSGTGVDTSTGAQLLASDDLISQLQSISGQSNYFLMDQDVGKSQELSENTLMGFSKTFGQAIGVALETYSKLGMTDAGSSKYRKSKSALCLMLLSIPEWPSQIPTNLCVGEQIPAEISGGPASAKIDPSTFTLPHEQRACLYRDYVRSSDIYQLYMNNQQ
jgi:hypothetical protein